MGRIMTVTLLLGLAVGISGCTLAYQPPLDIPAAPYVFQGTGGAFDPIRIEDATDPETVIPSRGGSFTFKAKLSEYGAAVAASLERELTKNGFRVTEDASKVIQIDVIDVAMAYPKKYRCDINLTVGVGEKRIGIATESEASALYDETIDAAIADAVRRIISNEEVVTFLTSKP
jgi:outer membrane lipopolysaccharide assembly protein LptE/RlpB